MEVLHPHCAGLDVHKDTVVSCVGHMVDGKVSGWIGARLEETADTIRLKAMP